MPLARISRTLSRYFSLSFIASGRSSGLHPVSSHSCCMYIRAGCPAFAWPYAGVHRSTSLMSSSLLLQQCPACLVRLAWIVFVMGGRWPYSWCLVGCCCQDLFNIYIYIHKPNQSIFNSSSPLYQAFGDRSKRANFNLYIITLVFHSIFSSLARFKYLFLFRFFF